MSGPRTYSFLNVKATIIGPNGAVILGSDAGVVDEGITAEYTDQKNTLTAGADGAWMHSLHASKVGQVSVRFLKNSPTNALLSAMYNADTSNPASHGQNVIAVTDLGALDVCSGAGCAFKKHPNVVYSKDGPMLEWIFDVGRLDIMLGDGI